MINKGMPTMLMLHRSISAPLAAFALAALVAGSTPDRAVAGGLFKKKGTLVAVPTAGSSASLGYAVPTATLGVLPVQSSPVQLIQVQQSTLQYAVPQVHYGIVQVPSTSWGMVTPQANPSPQQSQATTSPTINITVVEAGGGDRPLASPTAQAGPSPQSGIVSVPQAAQAAPVFYATPAVPAASPVQLFYVPPSHSCNAFCRH